LAKKKDSKEKVATKVDVTSQKSWLDDNAFPPWIQAVIAFALILIAIYSIFPLQVFKGYDFLLGGDNLSAAPIAAMGEKFLEEGHVPQWCPYIFCGMPMVGSLMFANHYYFVFTEPFKTILSIPYFGSKYYWLFFHYHFLAALGIFFLLKRFKVHWALAVICGFLFAFNPSMIVYADVGHGSKVMTFAYLPWVLFVVQGLFRKPNIGWTAVVALVFGLQLSALHVQIAYYGAMMMGLYVVYRFIADGKTGLKSNLKALGLLVIAGIIAFGISSPLYLQVLEYSEFSQRGGTVGGGNTWDYATAWSFHPLESLTYIIPSFYGFGGQSYWGHMPFTDMPLYWGGVALLFVPIAVILKRDRFTIFLVILAAAAWIVSFGKFLPVLYWPLYEYLPYFNKFRVPSLIQGLVLLAAVLLAGRGLQAIWEKAKSDDESREIIGKRLLIAGGIIAGLCLLFIVLQGAFKQSFFSAMATARPRMQVNSMQEAYGRLIGDTGKLLLLTVVLYGTAVLILLRKAPLILLVGVTALAAIVELSLMDKDLMHPTPGKYMEDYLAADDVVKFLQRDETPFRIFPLSKTHNPDWFMNHRLESIDGYSASKPRLYQDMKDSLTLTNPNVLRMMNTKYFIIDKPIGHADLEQVFTGQKEIVYRFKPELPRAFLVNQFELINEPNEAFRYYRRGDFDFGQIAVLQELPAEPLAPDAQGTVKWLSRSPDHLELEVETSGNQMLVLSEPYYPSGWTAKLDGAPAKILRTNYMFRSVEVPTGKHVVRMDFKPLSAGKGFVFQILSLLIICIVGAKYFISFILRVKSQKA